MKSNFDEHRENRIARFEELADKAKQESESTFNKAFSHLDGIEPGQPILVGHHSEGKHRRALERHDNSMRSAFALEKKATYYANKAEAAAANTAIFSDDPAATEKLAEKIERLEARQRMMRDANKLAAKKDVAGLEAMGYSQTDICRLLNPKYTYEKPGYQGWELSNNSANIRRLKQRLVEQVALESRESVEIEINGIRILENTEENRTQMFFPSKPSDEIRSDLKRSGFRWSPSQGAWQRHISSAARYHAERIAKG